MATFLDKCGNILYCLVGTFTGDDDVDWSLYTGHLGQSLMDSIQN